MDASDISANTTGSIQLPAQLFASLSDSDGSLGLVFTMFNTSVLYPLANETRETFAVASSVVGATVAGRTVRGLSSNVTIVLKLMDSVRIINCIRRIYFAYIHNINHAAFVGHQGARS